MAQEAYKMRHFCNRKVLYENLMKSPKINYVQLGLHVFSLSLSLSVYTTISMSVSLRPQKSFITSGAGSEARACDLLSP